MPLDAGWLPLEDAVFDTSFLGGAMRRRQKMKELCHVCSSFQLRNEN